MPKSEVHLGGGIMLTNHCSPRKLPDLPFGVRYDPLRATSGLKNNLLCRSLSGLEISRLMHAGLRDPSYVTTEDGLKVFTMLDCGVPDNSVGFVERAGVLTYVDSSRTAYILTFAFVMLLVATNKSMPLPLRKASFSELSERPTEMPLKLDTNWYSVGELFSYLNDDDFGNPPSPNLVGDEVNYTPQGGIADNCQPCVDLIRDVLTPRVNMDEVRPLGDLFSSKFGMLGESLLSHLAKGNLYLWVVVTFVSICLMRGLYALAMSLKFWIGVFFGIFTYSYERQIRKSYKPQSGSLKIRGDQVSRIARLLITAGQLIAGAVSFVSLLFSFQKHEAIGYEPQAAPLSPDDGAAFTGKKVVSVPKPTSTSEPGTTQTFTLGWSGGIKGSGSSTDAAPRTTPPKPIKKDPNNGLLNGFGIGI